MNANILKLIVFTLFVVINICNSIITIFSKDQKKKIPYGDLIFKSLLYLNMSEQKSSEIRVVEKKIQKIQKVIWTIWTKHLKSKLVLLNN